MGESSEAYGFYVDCRCCEKKFAIEITYYNENSDNGVKPLYCNCPYCQAKLKIVKQIEIKTNYVVFSGEE